MKGWLRIQWGYRRAIESGGSWFSMKRDIIRVRVMHAINRRLGEASRLVAEEKAQGTTEYAILVGVLVVIAIIAIIAFRDRVSELWNAISNGINSL